MSYKPAKALSRATLMRSCVLLCVVLGGLRALCAPPHLTVDEWPSSSWGCSWVGPGHFGVERAQIQARLERLPGKQLVFVRYLPGHEVDDEWVYNLSDIDDSKVIWARDMGAADDLKLLHYYRDRMAWFVEPDTTPATLTPYPGPAQTDAH